MVGRSDLVNWISVVSRCSRVGCGQSKGNAIREMHDFSFSVCQGGKGGEAGGWRVISYGRAEACGCLESGAGGQKMP